MKPARIVTIRRKGDSTKPLPAWARGIAKKVRLGDKVAAVATPVARAFGLPCIDPQTKQLRPESGCAKRKRRMNGE